MMKNQRGMIAILAACASILSAAATAAQTEWSGSFNAQSGILFPREDTPDDAMQDWFSRITGNTRLRGGQGAGRFACDFWAQIDPSVGALSHSLDEAWGQWSPVGWMSLRLGRSRLSFGPCLAFSPANSFQSRNTFDARAGKLGLDGLQTELRPLEAIWPNLPLGLSLQADFVLPPRSEASPPPSLPALPDLDRSSGRARLVFLFPEIGILAQTELGFSGDLRDLGLSERPWATGCWLSADISGFVLGAEGGLRSPGYSAGLAPTDDDEEIETAFGLSRKLGDFFCAAEGRWSSLSEAWQGFFRLSYAHDDFSISGTALADFTAEAARTGLDASWNASDELVVKASIAWNYEPDRWTEPGPLPVDGSAYIAAEWYF